MLKRQYLEQKLYELDNLQLAVPGSENAVEYRNLKARQAKAYRKEYYKALTREEPQIGDNTKYGNPFFKVERRVNTDGALWQ